MTPSAPRLTQGVVARLALATTDKNYTKLENAPPPASAFALDPSCPKPPKGEKKASVLPSTRSEAIATRQLGPYTAMLLRHLSK